MLRKLCIVPTFVALLMVLFVTFVPHHHHQAMICLVHETCEADGCINDEHTGHSDADSEEESHCVSHEKYFLSDDLKIDSIALITAPSPLPTPASSPLFVVRSHCRNGLSHSSPSVLTWRMRC